MNKIFKTLSLIFLIGFFTNCSDGYGIREEILNEDTQAPFVMVQDMNEIFTGLPVTWNRRLRSENNRTQVRVKYFCEDPNVTTHEIVISRFPAAQMVFDDPSNERYPITLKTISNFPTDVIFITKAEIASALGVTEAALAAAPYNNRIFFSGRSRNSRGKEVNGRSRFEAFTGGTEVRHAYIYEWRFNEGD